MTVKVSPVNVGILTFSNSTTEHQEIEELNTKYGDGSLDLESGTFTPNKSE